MTKEEIIDNLELYTVGRLNNAKVDITVAELQKIINAIKALEQKSVLDKIKAEIIDTGAYEQETKGKTEFLKGVNYCLSVFDKYKAENEDEA